ncbi:hypothetical protein HYC85_006156 [Camellia sinensis]|uniref:DNA2/NAM7 helicase helicase domain-containing protein n=1 Tax=Camellia sinensis TaxID=4442 RepID=A0A7J7HK77_CAMSI|nr:hypothetical protein HYC85_006156 [Camellia sinensis]
MGVSGGFVALRSVDRTQYRLRHTNLHTLATEVTRTDKDWFQLLKNCALKTIIETYLRTYEALINPLNGQGQWPKTGCDPLLPPKLKKPTSRPQKQRIRDPDEPQNQFKLQRKCTNLKCSKCGVHGHNQITYKGPVKGKKDGAASSSKNMRSQQTFIGFRSNAISGEVSTGGQQHQPPQKASTKRTSTPGDEEEEEDETLMNPPSPSPYLTFLPSPANPNFFYSHLHHHPSLTTTTNSITSPTPPPLPLPQPPDLPTALSTLKHLIHLSKTTIHSISTLLPTTTTTTVLCPCPFNFHHCLPSESLFRHSLQCPSFPFPLFNLNPLLLQSLRYLNTLKPSRQLFNQNCFLQTLHNTNSNLCFSLDDYCDFGPNFFYRNCPSVVSSADRDSLSRTFTLPGSDNGEIKGFSRDCVRLLPLELWLVRSEIESLRDYPIAYSYRLCLKAIVREATGSVDLVLYDDGDVEVLRLDKERWELVDNGHKPTKIGTNCIHCLSQENDSVSPSSVRNVISSFNLDDSQKAVVLSYVATRECHHQNTVKLIWGPSGTGKTKTVGSLLFYLLKLKCRTLICAPTNIAVLGSSHCMAHEFVLFGNWKRMKIDEHEDLLDVILDYPVFMLRKAFAPRLYLENWEKENKKNGEEPEETNFGDRTVKSNQEDSKPMDERAFWRKTIVQTLKKNKNKKK